MIPLNSMESLSKGFPMPSFWSLCCSESRRFPLVVVTSFLLRIVHSYHLATAKKKMEKKQKKDNNKHNKWGKQQEEEEGEQEEDIKNWFGLL